MKVKSGDIEITINDELVGSGIGKKEVKGVAFGLINCRNHKTGLALIEEISDLHLNSPSSFVSNNTAEEKLYQDIQNLIIDYQESQK